MNNSSSVISLQNLCRRFDQILAVDNVSLDFPQGQFFALLGPSGCGKTTLLRMIAGFDKPDSGKILLEGNDISSLRPGKRPVNMMFQSYALFPHMSVYANVAYGLQMEKLATAEVRRRTGEILERTQLSAFADRKPSQLSGGQRQRVALARAIVKQPRVLLLDEPLGALDKKLREQMQIELKRLQHDLGITFVVVTHDQDEALVMADRIALMKDGAIEQVSSPRQLYDHPVNHFVADFIGSSNFISGTITDNGIDAGQHGHLGITHNESHGHNSTAEISIRPERVTLSRERPSAELNTVQGEVENIAYHGQSVKIMVRIAGMERPIIAELGTADEATLQFAPNQSVWCNWRPADGRLLLD